MNHWKFLFALVATFLASPCSAQEFDSELQRADSLFSIGARDTAISITKVALAKSTNQFGANHLTTATIAHKLGSYYYNLADYASAEVYHKQALSVLERVLSPLDTAIASACFDLAGDYLYQGQFDNSRPLFYQSLQVRERTLGSNHPEVARSLNALAAQFIYEQRFDEALPLCERALTIWQDSPGWSNPYAGRALTNIAIARTGLGDFAAAETLYVNLVRLQERELGESDPEVANALIGLAGIRYRKGNYSSAKPLYQRAIAIDQAHFGDDHYITALARIDLANLYVAQAKRYEAEAIFRQSLEVLEKSLGPENLYVANTLKLLAGLHTNASQYADAAREYQRALTITREAIGDSVIEVGNLLASLGDVADLSGDYKAAESLYTASLKIVEKNLGSNDVNLLPGLNGIAVSLCKLGDYGRSEMYFRRALEIGESFGGKKCRPVAETLEWYADYLRVRDRGSAAQSALINALDIRLLEFHTGASVMPERDALSYAWFLRNSLNHLLSCMQDGGRTNQETASELVKQILRCKGIVTDEFCSRGRLETMAPTQDSQPLTLLKKAKIDLSRLFVRGPQGDSSYAAQLDHLSRTVDSLEELLARLNPDAAPIQAPSSITIPALQSVLPANSALIEYVRYTYFMPLAEKGVERYCAVVVRPSGVPVLADLGAASLIDSLVEQYRKHMERVADGSGHPSADESEEYLMIAGDLAKAVWVPISSVLPDSGMLLLSPDGSINLVSFAGLPNGRGRYMIEDYTIQYLSSGRDLLRLNQPFSNGTGLLAMGNPDFDASRQQRRNQDSQNANLDSSLSGSRLRSTPGDCLDLTNLKVQGLPATRLEIDQVGKLWSQFNPDKSLIFTGAAASEENFKRNAPGRRLIHIATHGYFAPSSCSDNAKEQVWPSSSASNQTNPLLVSGLLLAGANNSDTDSLSEDGILTAEEVSALNLSGTQRVVLSACESGLGEITTGEGVFGLRRAFLMAGARTVVSSLWQVPDNVTSQMMSTLYQDGRVATAPLLREAMLFTLKKLRARGQPDHPFTWAPFISIGDWRN